jgi:malonyl-CoA O-methyltransferase
MLVPASEAYRLWAPAYDSTPNPLLALEARLFSEFVGSTAHGTVLDIGCGTGRSMSRYSSRRTQIFGADCSAEMLAEAARKEALSGRLVLAEATALPFPDGVADLTVCSFAVGYFLDLKAALSEIARVTKRSGRVALSDLHPAAMAQGWSRSFRVGDETYEIQHTVHSDGDFRSALGHAELHELMQVSATFSEHERSLFVAAGKEHLFVGVANTPAVRIGIYSKR